MSDPQVWTLVGVFAASTFGMTGLTTTLFMRWWHTAVDGLRGELTGEIRQLRGEMRAEFADVRSEMRTELARVRADIRMLDQDISAIAKRVFPDES